MAKWYPQACKRSMDIVISALALLLLAPLMLLVFLLVKITSAGPAIFWSDRIGRNGDLFAMPKFRTMYIETPVQATDQMGDPSQYITPIGTVLRKLSFDELPQLWCIFTGSMSLVGPRPALKSQTKLIALRQKGGVNLLKPGLTGLAQINGRDFLTDCQKVGFDKRYLEQQSIWLDVSILLQTLPLLLSRRGIMH